MKTILAAIAAPLLMGISLFAADPAAAPTTPRKAPDFAFNLPGKGEQQLSQYRGKVVALEFIFTTCPHCQAASKVMTKFQEDYAARGLQVIDVAVNPNADLLVENFVKDYKVGFPVGFVTPDKMLAFMGFDSNSRYVVPQLALIDRKGMIRYQTTPTETPDWDKLMGTDALRAHIEELLSTGGNSTASTGGHKKALDSLDVPARFK